MAMIDISRVVKLAGELRSLSYKYGIPAIDVEDGLILQALAYIVALKGGKTAIDAGAGIGYSTLWIALGMEHGCTTGACRVIAIEYSRERASLIADNLSKLGFSNVNVETVSGDALIFLEDIEDGSIDYAFIDVEKEDYPHVVDLLQAKLARGGIALFHNAFFPRPPEEFFDKVRRRPWTSMISPTPAGLLIAVKAD